MEPTVCWFCEGTDFVEEEETYEDDDLDPEFLLICTNCGEAN